MSRTGWPAVSVKFAPNPGTFVETTQGVTGAGAALAFNHQRGRQYELGRSQVGTGAVQWDNRDGRYVPTNASSPYAGLLQLYRELKVEATWNGTTYGVVRGFIERWPVGYSANGNFSETTSTVVDALAILGGQKLRSVADHECLADSARCLFKLSEPSSSTSAGDTINPAVNPSAVRIDGKYGARDLNFGAATGMPDGSTGVQMNTGSNGDVQIRIASALALAYNSTAGTFVPAGGTAHSIELTFVSPTVMPVGSGRFTLMHQSGTSTDYVELFINQFGQLVYYPFHAGLASSVTSPKSVCDGKLHHVVCTLGNDRKTVKMYLDGALVATTVSPSTLQFSALRNHILGARLYAAGPDLQYGFPGTIARYAVYSIDISAAAPRHYNATINAHSGEDSGARIARLLGYAGWSSAMYDIGPGVSVMGPAITEGKSALEGIQDAASDELGNLWVSGAGKITFRGRQVRQTTLTSSLTFGELESAGELPYDGTVNFDYDPSYVIDEQQVSRKGGSTVTARAATTVLPYHKSGNPRTIGVLNDYEATDQANWLITQYATPRLRVASLTIIPSANPALWPAALGTEINTRVTVKRRALNQPTVSLDCWVEAIQHRVTPTQWLTTFLLSPVDSPRAALFDVDLWDASDAVWTF
ncbi:MAG: hypothetical protein JWP11_1341 [Frankiales bacterium]|nr:hypothetical protein [Frankiales bacterium]